MDAAPLAALDLPLKVLVWDDAGQTKVTYYAPAAPRRPAYRLSADLEGNLAAINPPHRRADRPRSPLPGAMTGEEGTPWIWASGGGSRSWTGGSKGIGLGGRPRAGRRTTLHVIGGGPWKSSGELDELARSGPGCRFAEVDLAGARRTRPG